MTRILGRAKGARRTATIGLAGASLMLLWGTSASAQFEMGLSGGYFVPAEGDGGPTGQIRLGGGLSDNLRLAGELEYRKSSQELLDVEDVDIHGIGLHALVNYIILPDAVVSPYLGAGLGLGVNIIDADKIEDELERRLLATPGVVAAEVDVTPVGLSLGVFGLIGLQVPLGDHVRLFAEGRYGGDWQVTGKVETDTATTSDSTDIDVENLGGFSGIGGLRFVF